MRYLSLLLALCLAACGGGGDSGPDEPEQATTAPDNTGDGWAVSTPGGEGMDAGALTSLLEDLRGGDYPGVDSMVIVRHGRLVAEGYFNGFGRESLHDLRSTGKSFTSALAGIAIDRGAMASDDPISQLLPQFDAHANMDDRKRSITVTHLLNMNSGLDCDDWTSSSPGNEEVMYGKNDWVDFILGLRMRTAPGVVVSYCTGGVVVLGHIIAQRSGMNLDDYAAANLFGPLGIRDVRWRRSPDGQATGGGGLWLRPRDAAKFGQLYLDGGVWNGAQVVPAEWVERSAQSLVTLDQSGYGLLWWKRRLGTAPRAQDTFFTSGNGGNFIFVIPALELVAVFTGSNYNSPRGDQPLDIVSRRLLEAVQ
jgi:CubicO group peptidase (beta-lactamase class C family)